MWLGSILHRLQSQRNKPRSTADLISWACFEALEGRQMLSFDAAVSYPAGATPQSVATADFNGDGRLDLAAVNHSSNTVSVLLANADGTFQGAQTSVTGAGPRSLAVGDFNDDGTLDLAVANTGGVSVLTGNGDGTFQAQTDIGIGSDPSSVAVGDFNGDGTLDLAVTSNVYYPPYCGYGYSYCYPYGYYSGHANVLLGNGQGSFSGPNATYAGGYTSGGAAVADFNGDGIDDLATLGDWGYGSVLLGHSGGYLQHPTYFSAGYYPWSVAAGDVDSDGDLDLVTANRYSNDVSVVPNDGAGGFGAARNYPAGSEPASVVLGDFDRDGKLDIATANAAGNNVSILRGRGGGDFAPAENFAAGPGADSIAAGDFNGDGWLDLATANVSGNNVSVLLNDRAWSSPPASLAINDVTITEGTGGSVSAVFTVTRGGSLAGTATVSYSTANGGALAGSDYAARSGTLTFADGVATMQITIGVNGDMIDEYDQGFFVMLSAASGAVITDGQGFGTIVDDDEAPTMTITPKVAAKEGRQNWSTSFTFAVTLSAPSEKEIWVGFATADGTATVQDSDYAARSGTLYFAPGTTSRSISVLVRGDAKKEANEIFYVNLSGVINSTILDGRGQGIGEILNDDKR